MSHGETQNGPAAALRKAASKPLLAVYRLLLRRLSLFRFGPSERPPAFAPPWSERRRTTPESLRTVPGIWREPGGEAAAFEERPLHDYFLIHWEATVWFLARGWHYVLPTMPRIQRALHRGRVVQRKALGRRTVQDPAVLKEQIKAEARRVGLHAIGFAPYDPKYTFAEYAGKFDTGAVIVCIVEQDYDATQTIPSNRAEKAAFHSYAELINRSAQVAEFIRDHGHRAEPHDHVGHAVVIHYGVEAGLGQLGINGQLLTPQAGSRTRIALITTDLEVPFDEPVDFGVNAICDACQVCVRRCPTGAIPAKRKVSRGVLKAKIKTERCLPVVAQVHGCAICMKVCPVQKYGLDDVIDHYVETGTILGKDGDDLEGFDWPLDGVHYGPGEKPRIDSAALLTPPDLIFDRTRLAPPSGARKTV